MQAVSRIAAMLLVVIAVSVGAASQAAAQANPPPVTCKHHDQLGQCVVTVTSPGGGSGGGGGSQPARCLDNGKIVPCERPGVGTWDPNLECYIQVMRPQPPMTNPVWKGHNGGAVYLCTVWPPRTTGSTEIWFATPPAAVDPRVLALQAEKTLVLPQPSGHRSPDETHLYQGNPFTYVNLWTWFWTDPGTWRARRATASAGGVTATVTVVPTRLTFDPGDGSAAVECTGPGRAWTSNDGNAQPSAGACGYQYLTATQAPITSTQSIRWSVTWRASDGTTGVLPDLITARQGQLMVLQIESVVSR
jgi:hypothetical protein